MRPSRRAVGGWQLPLRWICGGSAATEGRAAVQSEFALERPIALGDPPFWLNVRLNVHLSPSRRIGPLPVWLKELGLSVSDLNALRNAEGPLLSWLRESEENLQRFVEDPIESLRESGAVS